MKDVVVGSLKLKMYDSIEELPMHRYMLIQRYILIDSGVGSSLQEFDRHISEAVQYIGMGEQAKASQTLQNLRQNIQFMLGNIAPRHYAFIAMIHSIDGKEVGALTDDVIEDLHQRLLKLSIKEQELADRIDEFKKKTQTELQSFFPDLFDAATEFEAISQARRKLMADLDWIITDDPQYEEAGKEVEDEFARKRTVIVFGGNNSYEVELERSYEHECIALSKYTNRDVKSLTVKEYYALISYVKKQAQKR